METLASLLWNPLFALIYVELGVLFLVVTRAAAWRRMFGEVRAVLSNGRATGQQSDGNVPHTQALFATLAASVGVGNLAGVGTAIHLGGPGALFWMWILALLGMSFHMSSAYWAVKLARRGDRADLFASPMLYMVSLLSERWKWLASGLALLLLIKGVVTANLIQANSVAHPISGEIGVSNLLVATLLGTAVVVVVVGGYKSVLRVSTTIAPWMILGYLLGGWTI